MDDPATIVMVAASTLTVLVFVAVQLRMHKARHQHSLGDMYRPQPKDKEPPTTPHW